MGKRLGRNIVCSRPGKWVSSEEIALGTCIRCGVYSPVIEWKDDDYILLGWLAGEGIREEKILFNLNLEAGS